MKPTNGNSYNSMMVLPNNHIKLMKIKRELYKHKNACIDLVQENKEKTKQKKVLEKKLEQVKQELEDMMNSKDTYPTDNDSSNYVEQKAVQVTSLAKDLTEEESKLILGDCSGNNYSSGTQTNYIQKISDRRLTQNPEEHRSISSSNAKSGDFSSMKEVHGPVKPLPLNYFAPKIISETISENPLTSIGNADIIGHGFPQTMESWRPEDLKIQNEEDFLKYRLPDVHHPNSSKGFGYKPNRNYFHNISTSGNITTRGRKSKSFIPKPTRKKQGNKTARNRTATRFPKIRGSQKSNINDSHNQSMFK